MVINYRTGAIAVNTVINVLDHRRGASHRSKADPAPLFPTRYMIARSQTLKVTIAGLALYAVYLPLALWIGSCYSAPIAPPGAVLQLGNCHKLVPDGFLYTCVAHMLRDLEDTVPTGQHSPVLVYENDRPLGPGLSPHDEIEKIGLGRYSHWKDMGILISTSDNSDPNTNGRAYWAVLPPAMVVAGTGSISYRIPQH